MHIVRSVLVMMPKMMVVVVVMVMVIAVLSMIPRRVRSMNRVGRVTRSQRQRVHPLNIVMVARSGDHATQAKQKIVSSSQRRGYTGRTWIRGGADVFLSPCLNRGEEECMLIRSHSTGFSTLFSCLHARRDYRSLVIFSDKGCSNCYAATLSETSRERIILAGRS